ncbi:MAG: hypothetical protein J4452_04835 [Candidatus Aenigmarchaeota archaeon]|nr:hypothetical protein [Candidatus Aenigmarchaeota archaeon]
MTDLSKMEGMTFRSSNAFKKYLERHATRVSRVDDEVGLLAVYAGKEVYNVAVLDLNGEIKILWSKRYGFFGRAALKLGFPYLFF